MSFLCLHWALISEIPLMGLWNWSWREAPSQGGWWNSFPEMGRVRFPFHGVGFISERWVCPARWQREPMRAQPPGPRDISVQQTAPAQPCRAQTEMKRLVGSCSLIGRKGLYFSPDRRMVPRMGGKGCWCLLQRDFLLCVQKHFSNISRSCCFCPVSSSIYQVPDHNLFGGF